MDLLDFPNEIINLIICEIGKDLQTIYSLLFTNKKLHDLTKKYAPIKRIFERYGNRFDGWVWSSNKDMLITCLSHSISVTNDCLRLHIFKTDYICKNGIVIRAEKYSHNRIRIRDVYNDNKTYRTYYSRDGTVQTKITLVKHKLSGVVHHIGFQEYHKYHDACGMKYYNVYSDSGSDYTFETSIDLLNGKLR
jgi:hypothetical protein